MKALLHGSPIVDHGSGEISDVVNILFLIYIFFYTIRLYITENCIVSKIIPMLNQLLD